ncbi:MAG: YncE family protein [Candidatus Kapaibacterium sp.]
MNTRPLALIVLMAATLFACSPEELFIDSFDDGWRLLMTNTQGSLVVTDVPDQRATTTVWSDAADSASYQLKRFRDRVYLLHSQRPWIVIFDADTLRAVDTIDLGSAPASSIAFANATTAFATIPSEKSVKVIDLTVGSVARTITLPSRPMNIDANGNQLCVTLPDTNSVAIIDSRTMDVEALVATSAVPWYVAADPANAVFCIVSIGAGKVTPGAATAATIQFLTATTRAISAPLDLTTRGSTATQLRPTGLIVTSTQLAFVSSANGLMRIGTRSRNRVTTMQPDNIVALSYNDARAEILAQLGGTRSVVAIYNVNGDARTASISVASPATSALGIAR